ncbi:MAG: GNAT family N-acetyltransferase, partial [Synergistaceae bacterium]|nr:GNAT family N-acetyltransferase [Synergistaceae bacterium]
MEGSLIWEDLKFFVDTLKILPVSDFLALSENGSYCVSTGTYSENWVYCPEREITPEMAGDVVRFFRECGDSGEAFMWPVYADSEANRKILEGAGLEYAGDLTAMCFVPKNEGLDFSLNDNVNTPLDGGVNSATNSDANTHSPKAAINCNVNASVIIQQVSLPTMADVWAQTAARGFGEEGASESYRKFVEALCGERGRVRMYLAGYGGENAGVYLVTEEPEMTGVYYFAVRPEFRRKGVARAMMTEICRQSAGKRVVLQSTPMGRNFYGAFGFTE